MKPVDTMNWDKVYELLSYKGYVFVDTTWCGTIAIWPQLNWGHWCVNQELDLPAIFV